MSETIIAAAVQIVAIAAAAGVGYLVGAAQTRERRRLEKQTNSIQVMLSLCNDRDLLEALRVVVKIDNDPRDNIESYAYPSASESEKRDEWSRKSQAVFSLVNYLETVSAGICEDIYDREIIRKCGRTTFTASHKRTAKFIREVRERRNAPNFAEHFERVAADFAASEPAPPQ